MENFNYFDSFHPINLLVVRQEIIRFDYDVKM